MTDINESISSIRMALDDGWPREEIDLEAVRHLLDALEAARHDLGVLRRDKAAPMNLEELATAAGFDVEPDGIRHPYKQYDDDPADQRDLLAVFAALVLEEAAKKAESYTACEGYEEAIARDIRAMKPVAVPTTSQWMPIETAPKDGKTEVWVYCPDAAYTKCDVARWDGDGRGGYGWVSARCVDGLAVDGTPTLWQPLPALPVAT